MSDARRTYPSDLSDAEWAILAAPLPPPGSRGRPRKWPERLIADTVCYVLRSGCAWRMLPREFPPGRSSCDAAQPVRLARAVTALEQALRAAARVSGTMISGATTRPMLRRLARLAA
jgi:transposase